MNVKKFPRKNSEAARKIRAGGLRTKETKTKKGLQVIHRTYSPLILFGGAEGDRTPGLLNAIQARSQLRHSPTRFVLSKI